MRNGKDDEMRNEEGENDDYDEKTGVEMKNGV